MEGDEGPIIDPAEEAHFQRLYNMIVKNIPSVKTRLRKLQDNPDQLEELCQVVSCCMRID